ncbi:transposase [Eubacterium sp. MSJ-21]|nr:transposase [Eubacterium sp. MSJ-21]
MAKYSFEFKKKVVNSYLNGEGSFKFIAEKYEIPACSNVEKWVQNYKNFGDEGLLRSRKNELYSFEYKLHVVELYLSSEISYQDLALQEGITNPCMITN